MSEIRNLDTGEVISGPTSPIPVPRTPNISASTDPTFVETADVAALYTSVTMPPRSVHVPTPYLRPHRPVHVGMSPDAALKAAAWIVLGLLVFFAGVFVLGMAVTPR